MSPPLKGKLQNFTNINTELSKINNFQNLKCELLQNYNQSTAILLYISRKKNVKFYQMEKGRKKYQQINLKK